MVFRVVHMGEQTFKKQEIVTTEVWEAEASWRWEKLLGCWQDLLADLRLTWVLAELSIYILCTSQSLCYISQ